MPGLLVVAVVHTAFWGTEDGFIKTVVPVGAALLYLSSIMAGFWMVMGKISWSWSLSVEEHFYFGWPPLVRWLFGDAADPRPVRGLLRRHPMRSAAGCALAVVAVAVGLRATFVDSVRWHDMLYYSTFTRMDALAIGCIAALLAWKYRLPLAGLAGWAALAVLGYCYVSPSFHIGRPSLNLWGLPLGSAAAAILVVSLVQRPRSALARVLSFRPLVHIGVVSYGLYLWNLLPGRGLEEVIGHKPPLPEVLLSWLAILVAVELSYWLVERPVQRWVRAWMRGERRLPWTRPEPPEPAITTSDELVTVTSSDTAK